MSSRSVWRWARWLPVFTCFALVAKGLVPGRVLLPAPLLGHIHPWRVANLPEWNVLAFDGLVQFVPWRMEVARQWREGRVPIGNPWSFASDGGAPLLANGQSAVWYPPNAAAALIGPESVPILLGWLVLFHLIVLSVGVARLAAALGIRGIGPSIAGIATTLSACVVTWVSLPTHLATFAWVPWMLLAIHRGAPIRAGAFAGLVILGGHLQIAAYGLAIGIGLAALKAWDRRPKLSASFATLLAFAVVSLPQLLPVVEMGRQGHRGGVAPTEPGYQAYVANAVPVHHAATFVFPDLYGSPSAPGDEWLFSTAGLVNQYPEWALYVGIPTVWLALVACLVPAGDLAPGIRRFRAFAQFGFAIVLMLAFGTPLNRLAYFLVPGFAATGNPGRCMVVGVLLLGLLAAIGSNHLTRRRVLLAGLLIVPVVLGAAAAGWRNAVGLGLDPAALTAIALPGAATGAFWFLACAGLLGGATSAKISIARPATAGIPMLLSLELLAWGIPAVPSAARGDVFRETPGVAWLRANAGEALVAPINRGWALGGNGPAPANPVLIPNSLLRWRLRDAGGYDSIILRETKDRIREVGASEPSPPENGNMVFVRDLDIATRLGATFAVLPPSVEAGASGWDIAYAGLDCTILKSSLPPQPPVPERNWTTTAVRLGIFLVACNAAFGLFLAGWKSGGRQRPAAEWNQTTTPS